MIEEKKREGEREHARKEQKEDEREAAVLKYGSESNLAFWGRVGLETVRTACACRKLRCRNESMLSYS